MGDVSPAPARQQPVELPAAGAPAERADAARNRAKVLAAARALLAEHGVEHVSIDDIARSARVGAGTIYRRFGDRSGLIRALLDEHERRLQDEILRGRPPLGPGAPAADRLGALLVAIADLAEQHDELVVGSETGRPGARFRIGAYAAWHQHATLLISDARPAADAPLLAHLVLAGVSGELQRYLRAEQRVGRRRMRRALTDLAKRVT